MGRIEKFEGSYGIYDYFPPPTVLPMGRCPEEASRVSRRSIRAAMLSARHALHQGQSPEEIFGDMPVLQSLEHAVCVEPDDGRKVHRVPFGGARPMDVDIQRC